MYMNNFVHVKIYVKLLPLLLPTNQNCKVYYIANLFLKEQFSYNEEYLMVASCRGHVHTLA